MADNTLTGQSDSGEDATLLTQEQEDTSGLQQPEGSPAADSGDESIQSEDANEAVEKRLRDTQAKVTELAEQLKAAQHHLSSQTQQREEPFDEEKFIDNFVGGEEAYNKYRDDPALLAKDITKKFLYHNAQVLADRDRYWRTQLDTVVNGIKTEKPEYAQFAPEIKEFEENFDLSGMTVEDKVKLAKMVRGKRGGSGVTPPPGPRASRSSATSARKSAAPAGYFELLGLAGEPKNENTLL